MKIFELAPFEEAVPPLKYGGTELVVSNITEELVRQGHEVFLAASGDSTTSATLVPILEKSLRALFPEGAFTPAHINERKQYWKLASLATLIAQIQKIKPDIVHNHSNWRIIPFAQFLPCPMMTTIHGPLTAFNERQTYFDHPEGNYISISNNQHKAFPEMHWVQTVYNGIAVDAFQEGNGDGDYFAFLGRTSPEKGLREICQMIKKTSYKLKIAAKVDVTDAAYFKKEIEPLIDGTQIQFLGEVDHAGKNELLKHAKALLLWLNWEEPFGLVVPEAMACGTPVIVNARGSMPELVIDGTVGFLVATLEEMQARLADVGMISRAACRAHAQEHFSVAKMTEGYVAAAAKIIEKNK